MPSGGPFLGRSFDPIFGTPDAGGPSTPTIHVRRFPEGTRIPRCRELTRLRPRARGQWLCRTLHPNPEGKSLVGADLRHDRGSAPGAARVPRELQRHLADRTAWLHHASGLSPQTASTRGSGRIAFNSVSQQPRAVCSMVTLATANR